MKAVPVIGFVAFFTASGFAFPGPTAKPFGCKEQGKQMIQRRKSRVPEKKSEFSIFAILWPGIGITVGISCGTALKNIGWGLTLGAIFGGLMSYICWRKGRMNPADQSKHDRTI